MGCFNTMGFHTHLPIIYGDDIVLFLGVYPEYEDKKVRRDFVTFAPGTDFTPIALPIFGKYDDYGSIENIVMDANVECIEKFFGIEITKVVDIVDDYMHGRYINDGDSELYEAMCNKIYDLQDNSLSSQYRQKYEVIFIIDHRFMYDTIKNLGSTNYNFEKSYDGIMELCPPWELSLVYDEDKVYDAETKKARGEITDAEYKKIKLLNGFNFGNVYSSWISYLNNGKCYWSNDYLIDITIPEGYSQSNIWENDAFDLWSVMGVYRDKENYKTLFTSLKEKYIEFLKFVAEFKRHQWCFAYHVYGTQETHCTTALPYYEAMLSFCKNVAEGKEEEERLENEAWESENEES